VIREIYVSGCEYKRAEARLLGYREVCQHPCEVGPLRSGDVIVIDLDRVLFGDRYAAAEKAAEAVAAGLTVGIHLNDADDPVLGDLPTCPTVYVGKSHYEVLAMIRQGRGLGDLKSAA